MNSFYLVLEIFKNFFKLAGKSFQECNLTFFFSDCKLGRGRVLTEKELIKLDSKRKKSEEAVRKCDLEYYSCTIKAERAR